MNIEPVLPHSDVILYLVQDDKESVHVGRSVPLSAFTKQSIRAKVGQYQIVITADHDCNAEKDIPSVTLHMNITETAGKCLYSVGPNRLCRIFVSFHNSTTDGSTGIKHIANAYEALINLSRKSRSAPSDQFIHILPYHVHFKTNGGDDYRSTTFPKTGCVSWSFLDW